MAGETEGIRYDSYGRMYFHPDFHANHKKPWKTTDEKYLIENYAKDGPEAVAAALERTIGVVMTRAYELRKAGKMPKAAKQIVRHRRAYAERGREAV